jgi:FtsP/CotA-like multicopper oxidase with cupredoxin domain
MQLEVGRKERWRVVNASIRNHPMHLHGFYFNVLSRGRMGADDVYEERDQRLVVTEFMRSFETMLMEWTPTRPGRWLFHCHLSFHVSNEIRLPGAVEADPEHAHSHMAGLVMGLEVAPGPTDLISEGEPVEVDLFAKVYGEETGNRFGFALTSGTPGVNETDAPGPLLVFNQHQTANVTVHNELELSTGVHWHGLELDGWADGVPGWSASDGMVSPAIPPGESFTYKLSLMRPGTFMYHTHMDDLVQLAGGLYGPLIVLPKGETYDPRYDHIKIFGWRTARPQGPGDFELNGLNGDPDAVATVGETHRFRVINIAPAGNITAWITRDGEPYPMRLFAKDGADLPEHQRVEAERLPRIGVGETSDFTWTPTEPGVYEIRVGFNDNVNFAQRWTVVAPEGAETDGRRR